MSSFSDKRQQFSKDKKELDPNFKPETNIPAKISIVRKIDATRMKNPDGDEYAVFKLVVDIESEDGILTKEWNISSEGLVATLEDKGVDIGSSFTVCKKGEGFQTKYEVTNVVNKAPAAPAQTGTEAA